MREICPKLIFIGYRKCSFNVYSISCYRQFKIEIGSENYYLALNFHFPFQYFHDMLFCDMYAESVKKLIHQANIERLAISEQWYNNAVTYQFLLGINKVFDRTHIYDNFALAYIAYFEFQYYRISDSLDIIANNCQLSIFLLYKFPHNKYNTLINAIYCTSRKEPPHDHRRSILPNRPPTSPIWPIFRLSQPAPGRGRFLL